MDMQQHSISMKRHTNRGTVRYYKLELFSTLFGEFVVEREYGNAYFKAPTGVKKDFFDSFEDAVAMFETLLKQKQKKGYKDARNK